MKVEKNMTIEDFKDMIDKSYPLIDGFNKLESEVYTLYDKILEEVITPINGIIEHSKKELKILKGVNILYSPKHTACGLFNLEGFRDVIRSKVNTTVNFICPDILPDDNNMYIVPTYTDHFAVKFE